jgi:hypothetical protein
LESRVQADSAAITPIVKRGLYIFINSSFIEKEEHLYRQTRSLHDVQGKEDTAG